MEIEFDITPDVVGMGRVICDGAYFGLPIEAVKIFDRLYTYERNYAWNQLIRIEDALDGGGRKTAVEIGDAVVAALKARTETANCTAK